MIDAGLDGATADAEADAGAEADGGADAVAVDGDGVDEAPLHAPTAKAASRAQTAMRRDNEITKTSSWRLGSAVADEPVLDDDDDDVQHDPEERDRHQGREHERDIEE